MLLSPLAIAPMIDWTYVHFRVLMRLLAPNALLYTEMQTTGAIMHQTDRALFCHPMETPLALQLGGADPVALAECARKAEQLGYAEINLNVGCPSDRVLAGQFGACLMAKPTLVADCVRAMKQAVNLPVTVKTRIGIDHDDSYAFFSSFVHCLVESGCDKLVVHARKAWLSGLNPKQNRRIPPLHYDYVYQIKRDFPLLPVVINGHIQSPEAMQTHLQHVDGVMIGRLACQHPYAIADLHHVLFPEVMPLDRVTVLQRYVEICQVIAAMSQRPAPMSRVVKPLFNLMHGLQGARAWKQTLMEIQASKNLDTLTHAVRWLSECAS